MGGCFYHQVSPHLDTSGYLEPWNISEFIRLAVWCYQLFDRKKEISYTLYTIVLQAVLENLLPAWTGGGGEGHCPAFAHQPAEQGRCLKCP